MKKIKNCLLLLFFIVISSVNAQSNAPDIHFIDGKLSYNGKEIQLGPHAFYIDGKLTDVEAARYPYVYNSINEAAKHLKDGTEQEPMVLYIAPRVYWIDNPDDPTIREPKQLNGTPFGLEIKCNQLKFVGLTRNPQDVILACNRGQTMGAKGNFTMLCITGDGTSAENITFGNYCNIDLEYPLNPALNRAKRGSAIVQAQLVFCFGDKITARNCRFVSRLNLCPFYGGKRTFFDRCHFECTDDALAPTGLYLHCTFDFYSSKPFGHTAGTGAILLDCRIRSFTRGEQYLVKGKGQIAGIDCHWSGKNCSYIGWREKPAIDARNYSFGQLFDNADLSIGKHHPFATVELTNKRLLDAYRFTYNGNTVYNIYNLLRGNDEWDPANTKESVLQKELESGKDYHNIATQLLIQKTVDTLETGKKPTLLTAISRRFGNYPADTKSISWRVIGGQPNAVHIRPQSDGTCEVTAQNRSDQSENIVIEASTPEGLQAATELTVCPPILEAPNYSKKPQLRITPKVVQLCYTIQSNYADRSLIKWYRCTDATGKQAIEVATSRFGKPMKDYPLSADDNGYYLMARIEARDVRSKPGLVQTVLTPHPVSVQPVSAGTRQWIPDLSTLSTAYQTSILPGCFTLDCNAPADTYDWEADNKKEAWYYGPGEDGAARDTGLVQASKGARLRYTPVGNNFGNMKIAFTAVPAKTAGQGFSSARQQYLDIFIKFDTKQLNGYALRLIRTTKYGDALDFVFVQYKNGLAQAIGQAVTTDCYRPGCRITLEVKGNQLLATACNPNTYYIVPNRPEVCQSVQMSTTITPNSFGGFGFQHTGTVGSGATLIKELKVTWE